MNPVKRLIEKITQGVLFTSSIVTSVTVLLVVIFLFREGIGLFNQTSVENHYVLVVNPANAVKQLTSKQVKDIFNQDVTNWKQVGGKDE